MSEDIASRLERYASTPGAPSNEGWNRVLETMREGAAKLKKQQQYISTLERMADERADTIEQLRHDLEKCREGSVIRTRVEKKHLERIAELEAIHDAALNFIDSSVENGRDSWHGFCEGNRVPGYEWLWELANENEGE